METQELKGIVVGAIDYKETSKIVYLFTEVGKISIRALGSKKPKKGIMSFTTLMNYVDAIVSVSSFPSLIDYSIIDTYDCIKDDLKKDLWFSYILEIVSKLPNDIDYAKVFPFLKRILDLGKNHNPMLCALVFQIKILYCFGVAPELKKCVICSNAPYYFSIKNGGALCINHHFNDSLNNNIFNAIKEIYYFDIYNGDIDTLLKYDLMELFKIINSYYNTHVHITLKGYKTVSINL